MSLSAMVDSCGNGATNGVCLRASLFLGEESFNIGDAGEVSLRIGKQFFLRTVEPGAIDRAGQVCHKHATARDIQCDADSLHQMVKDDLLTELAVNDRTIHGIAAWRVAAIGPVQPT